MEGLFLIVQIYVHMDAWIVAVFQDTQIYAIIKVCVTKMGNFVGNWFLIYIAMYTR